VQFLDQRMVHPQDVRQIGVGRGKRDEVVEEFRHRIARAPVFARQSHGAQPLLPDEFESAQGRLGSAFGQTQAVVRSDLGEDLIERRSNCHVCQNLSKFVGQCPEKVCAGSHNGNDFLRDNF
jgi:hypothetical protein